MGYGPLGWLRWAWRSLTSMRTALVLLFLLALAAVPGSIIPQRRLSELRVDTYYRNHPTLAPILNRLSLFDVFGSPWFAAIYLLLFVSLVGCVVPRSWRHVQTMRARPPAPPRRLERLPQSDSWTVDGAPDATLAAVRNVFRRRHFRTTTYDLPSALAVSAEKGYLREVGNIVFHLALVALLVGVALGGLFGYKATRLVVEGTGFSNSLGSFDAWSPGRLTNDASLQPFTLELRKFNASYVATGGRRGEPIRFDANVRYRPHPGADWRTADIEVNHPLVIGSSKVYLIGHGYAPTFTVRDDEGHTVFSGAVPFPKPENANLLSSGVIKVPDARPEQLGFSAFFIPTAVPGPNATFVSAFPGARNPAVSLLAFRGDLGLDNGLPQSVYALDDTHLHQVATATLGIGDSMHLPGGKATVTFTGYKQWATFQVSHDPGKRTVLIAAVLIIGGLILSLRVRRRRMWVRVSADPAGRTVVEAGGLGRSDGFAFAEEFTDLSAELRAATEKEST